MNITFLGTSAANAFPEAFCQCKNCEQARELGGVSLRKRSAALINSDLLIDLGPDIMTASFLHSRPLTHVRYCLQTHAHSDHLDPAVIRELAPQGVRFAVPLGVGADLEAWGVAAEQIIELDWWEGSTVGSLALVATPARHFSGWQITDRDRTLWASWTLVGPRSRVFYSGDTGWLDEFEKIGGKYGPFDLTIVKCGAYGEGWPDIHINGNQAVEAHKLLRGRRMLPVHWLTFDLALHPWDEPIRQVVETGAELGVEVVTPRVGQLIDLDGPVATERWWEELD